MLPRVAKVLGGKIRRLSVRVIGKLAKTFYDEIYEAIFWGK